MPSNSDKDTRLSDVTLQINDDDIKKDIDKINKQRQPKRILHFSDGDLVEYSDGEETDNSQESRELVDPKSLDWVSWTLHQTSWFGSKVLEGCDYVGEALADFLGITSPKYQYEINEYNRLQKLQEEERAQELKEIEGWNPGNTNRTSLIVADIRSGE
ncbi:protein FAM177A1 [Chelonus insularis]|uniref:protein FAM177A1 n=1 Tax=Chelonus insularis TaxID=460826 RepID=UPI00158F13E5|nr:protein FAM177A1-like [Chelonus insularis]